MSVPGYRNTAPPMVFLDFSRQSLEEIADGNYSNYQDPFDLRETLKDFRYTLTKGNVPGEVHLTLINPSQQVEERIFSWFASINPRSYTASETETEESWADRAAKHALLFLRWGYINPDENGEAGNALSHIHEMLIYDIGYEVNDKQDRVVTLHLQNQQDISIRRQAAHKRDGKISIFSVDAETENGKSIREPASILKEMLSKLAAGDGIISYVKFSDQQQAAINDAFDGLGRRDLPEGRTAYEMRASDGIVADYGGYDTLRLFFQGIDLDVSVRGRVEGILSPLLQKAISPSQTGGTIVANLAPETAVFDAENASKNNEAATIGPIKVNVNFPGYRTILDDGTEFPTTEESLSEVYLVNPFRPASFSSGDAVPAFFDGSVDKYSTQFTQQDLRLCLERGKVYLLPVSRYALYKDFPGALTQSSPGVYEFDPDFYPTLRVAIENVRDNFYGQLHQIDEENVPDEDLTQALINFINETEGTSIPPVVDPPEEPPVEKSKVFCTTASRSQRLIDLLDVLNKNFFETTGDYIDTAFIQTSVVEVEDREAFTSELPGVDIDWSKDKGVVIVAPIGVINTITRNLVNITSFDIQAPDNQETVILSTGFSKNKRNIVTDVSYRQTKSGWFQEFYQAPIIVQQLYDIGKRFEQAEYRDTILYFISIGLRSAGDDAVTVYENQEPVQESPISFEDSVLEEAFAAVQRSLSDNDYIYGDITAQEFRALESESKKNIRENFSKDIEFIKSNDLINVFFPQTNGTVGTDEARGYVDNGSGNAEETKEERVYRVIAPSPLNELFGSEVSPEKEAILLASKLKSLQDFRSRILNVRLKTLGIPEMDLYTYELNQRKIGLLVAEPRVPGTYHWLTGVYYPIDITHRISPSEGYITEIELRVTETNTADELLNMSLTFLEGNNND